MSRTQRSSWLFFLLIAAALVVAFQVSRKVIEREESSSAAARVASAPSETTATTTAPIPPTASGGSPARQSPAINWDPTSTYHTVEGAPAFQSAERFEEFRSYLTSRDNGALHQMIESGDCILLKPGSWCIRWSG